MQSRLRFPRELHHSAPLLSLAAFELFTQVARVTGVVRSLAQHVAQQTVARLRDAPPCAFAPL